MPPLFSWDCENSLNGVGVSLSVTVYPDLKEPEDEKGDLSASVNVPYHKFES